MRERIFKPAGMGRTTLDFEAGSRNADHAEPHAYAPDQDMVRTVPMRLRALHAARRSGGSR